MLVNVLESEQWMKQKSGMFWPGIIPLNLDNADIIELHQNKVAIHVEICTIWSYNLRKNLWLF